MADTDPPLPPIPTPSKNKLSKKKTTKIKTAPPMASLARPSSSTGSLSAALTLTASLEDPSTTIIVQPVSMHPAPMQAASSKSKHPSSKQKPSSKVAATLASNEIASARLASSAAESEVPASTTTATGVSEASATTGDLESGKELKDTNKRARSDIVSHIKKDWNITELVAAFPKSIRPTNIGQTAISNLRSICIRVPKLADAQNLFLEYSKDENGKPIPFGWATSVKILQALREKEKKEGEKLREEFASGDEDSEHERLASKAKRGRVKISAEEKWSSTTPLGKRVAVPSLKLRTEKGDSILAASTTSKGQSTATLKLRTEQGGSLKGSADNPQGKASDSASRAFTKVQASSATRGPHESNGEYVPPMRKRPVLPLRLPDPFGFSEGSPNINEVNFSSYLPTRLRGGVSQGLARPQRESQPPPNGNLKRRVESDKGQQTTGSEHKRLKFNRHEEGSVSTTHQLANGNLKRRADFGKENESTGADPKRLKLSSQRETFRSSAVPNLKDVLKGLGSEARTTTRTSEEVGNAVHNSHNPLAKMRRAVGHASGAFDNQIVQVQARVSEQSLASGSGQPTGPVTANAATVELLRDWSDNFTASYDRFSRIGERPVGLSDPERIVFDEVKRVLDTTSSRLKADLEDIFEQYESEQ